MNGFKVDARTSAMLINHTTHTFTHACTHARMHILCLFFTIFWTYRAWRFRVLCTFVFLSIAFSCVHFFLAVYLVMRTNIVGFYTEGERANDNERERGLHKISFFSFAVGNMLSVRFLSTGNTWWRWPRHCLCLWERSSIKAKGSCLS